MNPVNARKIETMVVSIDWIFHYFINNYYIVGNYFEAIDNVVEAQSVVYSFLKTLKI